MAPGDFDAELRVETTTIMFADVVESVRLIEQDELANVTRIRALLKHLAEEVVPKHKGTVLERRGDGILVRFPDSRCAAACALRLHAAVGVESTAQPIESAITLRIGVHSAEVLVDDDSIYGQGINLTARLANLAEAGQTILSAPAKEQLVIGLDADVEDIGECYLKHVATPVHAYRIRSATGDSQHQIACGDGQAEIRPKVAVLPFGSVPTATGLAAASLLTEEVTLGLSRVSSLRVLSRLTMLNVRSERVPISDIARRFGADYVLSGSLREISASCELIYELVDTGDGAIVYSHRVAEPMSGVVSNASTIVANVCESTVRAVLEFGLRQVSSQPLPNLRSHTLLSAAVSLMHRGGQTSDRRATDVLDELMDRHKRHATPFAWAAKQHFLKMWRGWSGDVAREGALASQYADQSLQKGASSALSYAVRGMVASHLERDFGMAKRLYDQALAIETSEPLTWIFKCALHTFDGDGKSAVFCASKALDLTPYDPLSYYYKTLAAGGLLTDGRYTEAIVLAAQALSENSSHHSTYRVLAIALGLNNELARGNAVIKRLLELDPTFSIGQFRARSPASRADEYARVLRAVGAPE